MKIKVAVGVSEGGKVLVGGNVIVGVSVGGVMSAVWVAAASAVNTMTVLIELGSNTGLGVDAAGTNDGAAQASINTVTIKIENILWFCRIMVPPRIIYWWCVYTLTILPVKIHRVCTNLLYCLRIWADNHREK
jgi:hypothetical protein